MPSDHHVAEEDFELREEMQAILEPQSLAGTSLQDLMREMLVRLGEDPERDGLRDTPERMERSMQYLTKGYQEDPEEILLGAMFNVARLRGSWFDSKS